LIVARKKHPKRVAQTQGGMNPNIGFHKTQPSAIRQATEFHQLLVSSFRTKVEKA